MDKNDLEQTERYLTILKDIAHSQKAIIERLASAQGETASNGMNELSEKLGEPFSRANKIHETLESLAHDLELERNRIKNEMPAE